MILKGATHEHVAPGRLTATHNNKVPILPNTGPHLLAHLSSEPALCSNARPDMFPNAEDVPV